MNYEKTKIALYYRMIGKGYSKAVKAFNFAQKYHTNLRKDGQPEFSHQVWIANYAVTLPNIPDDVMDILLAAIFLHDVMEDYHISFETISELCGPEVARIVFNLSKVYLGEKVDETLYFSRIAECPLSALAKGCDRLHNLSSMVGAFTIEKQKEYIEESETHHIPFLKAARKDFAEYELAYENLKLSLQSRISLIKEIHKAFEKTGD